jgi:chorismate mutase
VSASSVLSRSRAVIGLRPALVAAFLMILVAGCGGSPPAPLAVADGPASVAPSEVENLLRLMGDRLGLMHDVARAKWNANRPIGDPEREQVLLREMGQQGREHGLEVEFTRAFFAAQIAAARRVQEADLARWRAEGCGPFAGAPELTALRGRIDDLNRDLLGALARARPRLGEAGTRDQLRRWAREALAGEGITDDVRTAAIAPLAASWPAPPSTPPQR